MRLDSSKEPELCHQRQVCGSLQRAPRLPPPAVLPLHHLSPALPSPVTNPSCLVTRRPPLYASRCTGLLDFSKYCSITFKMFSFVCVFMYHPCGKYYKPTTVQYPVSWVPRLTLSDLQETRTHECVLGTDLNLLGTCCIYCVPFTPR